MLNMLSAFWTFFGYVPTIKILQEWCWRSLDVLEVSGSSSKQYGDRSIILNLFLCFYLFSFISLQNCAHLCCFKFAIEINWDRGKVQKTCSIIIPNIQSYPMTMRSTFTTAVKSTNPPDNIHDDGHEQSGNLQLFCLSVGCGSILEGDKCNDDLFCSKIPLCIDQKCCRKSYLTL